VFGTTRQISERFGTVACWQTIRREYGHNAAFSLRTPAGAFVRQGERYGVAMSARVADTGDRSRVFGWLAGLILGVVASAEGLTVPATLADPIEIRSRSRLDVETATLGLRLSVSVRVEDDAGEPVAQVPVRLELVAASGQRMEFVQLTDRAGQARLVEVMDEGDWSLRVSWDGRGAVDPMTELRSLTLRSAAVAFEGPEHLFLTQTQVPADFTWRALVNGQPLESGAWVATSECLAITPSEGGTFGQGMISLSARRLSPLQVEGCNLRLTLANGDGWQGGAILVPLLDLPASTGLGVEVQAEGAVPWLSDSWLVTPWAASSAGPLSMGVIEVWHEDSRLGDYRPGTDTTPLVWTPEVTPQGSLELRLLDDAGALAARVVVPLSIPGDPFGWLPWVPVVAAGVIVLSWLVRSGMWVWLPALTRKSASRTPRVASEQAAVRVEDADGRTSRLIVEDSHTRMSIPAQIWTKQGNSDAFAPLPVGVDPWLHDADMDVRIEAPGYANYEARLSRPDASVVVVVRLTENRRLVLATFTETLGSLGAERVPTDWWGKRSPSEFLVPAMEMVRGLRQPSAPTQVRRRRFNELQAADAGALDPVDALEALFLLVDEVCFGTARPVPEAAVIKAQLLADRVLNRAKGPPVMSSARTE